MLRLFKNRVFIIAAVLLIAGLAAWRWSPRSANGLVFTTAPIKRGSVTASIGATGTIEPLETVDVGAQVAGRISAFGKDTDDKLVDYGSLVQEGALLAKIDDSVYAADL